MEFKNVIDCFSWYRCNMHHYHYTILNSACSVYNNNISLLWFILYCEFLYFIHSKAALQLPTVHSRFIIFSLSVVHFSDCFENNSGRVAPFIPQEFHFQELGGMRGHIWIGHPVVKNKLAMDGKKGKEKRRSQIVIRIMSVVLRKGGKWTTVWIIWSVQLEWYDDNEVGVCWWIGDEMRMKSKQEKIQEDVAHPHQLQHTRLLVLPSRNFLERQRWYQINVLYENIKIMKFVKVTLDVVVSKLLSHLPN